MTQTLNNDQKTQVILAASIIAGKGASENEVAEEASRIAARLGEGSQIQAAFERIEKRDEATEKVKTFRATIIGIDKEVRAFDRMTGEVKAGSGRGIVLLKTAPSKFHPNGQEYARTDRTDSPEGLWMAKDAQALIGHQVAISVGVEGTGEVKVRVIRSITDQGVDPTYDPDSPACLFDYNDLDKTAPGADFRRRLATQTFQPA